MSRAVPSVLVVLADQMRGRDMGGAGNTAVHTPSMDALTGEGTMFSRCYANTPVCTPNRASLLTGLYPTTHRVLGNDLPLSADAVTVGEVTRDAGYATGYIGKWHLDGVPRDRFTPPGPRRHGFDFWAAFNCHHNYFAPRYYRDTPELIQPEGYEPVRQTDLAVDFLNQLHEDEPFNLWVSWGPPHDPYHLVPDEFRKLYDPTSIELPPTFQTDTNNPLAANLDPRRTLADYYAAITALDRQLGRLLTTIRRLDRTDDTLVVFSSDHGDMLWSHGWMKKQLPYEESIQVPLIMRWPEGLPAARRFDDVVSTVDLAPTLVDLLGLHFPERVDGRTVAPYLRIGEDPGDSAILISNPMVFEESQDQEVPEWRGLRTNRWTYAETVGSRPWLLFDNETDPWQTTNVAVSPTHQSIVSRLSSVLHDKLRHAGDPFLDTAGMLSYFSLQSTWQVRQRMMHGTATNEPQ